MSYLFFMSVVLVLGTVVLMAGNLLIRDPRLSKKEAFGDSVAWGLGFLSFFAAEFIILGNA
jgi:hypothetical protein